MFRPGNNPYNNCVVYSEYYYLSAYSQYKSLNIFQCPEEAKYAIKDKNCVLMIVKMIKNINIYLMEIVIKNVLLEL